MGDLHVREQVRKKNYSDLGGAFVFMAIIVSLMLLDHIGIVGVYTGIIIIICAVFLIWIHHFSLEHLLKRTARELVAPLEKIIADYEMQVGSADHLREELAQLRDQTVPALIHQRTFLVRRVFDYKEVGDKEAKEQLKRLLAEIESIEKILRELQTQLSPHLSSAIFAAATGSADASHAVKAIRSQIESRNAALLDAYRSI